MKEFFAITRNNIEIYVDEATRLHMEAHSDVKISDMKEGISLIEYQGPFFIDSIDLGRIVGKDNCVAVAEDEKKLVQYRTRKNRQGKTPVIMAGQKEPADTSLITIGICKDSDGKDTLFTAFYGYKGEKEPWERGLSPEQKRKSEDFWSTHALICMPEVLED